MLRKTKKRRHSLSAWVVACVSLSFGVSGNVMGLEPSHALKTSHFSKTKTAPAATLPVRTQDIEIGFLDIVWHDNFSGSEQVTIELVNDQGRTVLNRGEIELASEDLYAMAGQKVAIYKNPRTQKVEAMVGIGDLSSLEKTHHHKEEKTTTQRRRIIDLPSGFPQSEQHRWKTIACKFYNAPSEPVTTSFLATQYGPVKGHIGHFWKEMSYGKISVSGSAHGWFQLPHPRSYYFIDGRYDSTRVTEDCINAAKPYVDFSNTYGINIALNIEGGPAQGGRKCGIEGLPQQCTPMTWLPPFAYKSLRVMMHEMGHAYTLPHSDNSDGDNDTYDNVWDLMSSISWAKQHPRLGAIPQYLTGWHRKRLNWMPAHRVEEVFESNRFPKIFYLDAVSDNAGTGRHMIILRENYKKDRDGNVTQPNFGVFYTIEARLKQGSFDQSLPDSAVIIHKVPNGMLSKVVAQDADHPPANRNNNEGSMFKVGESFTPVEGFGTVRILARTSRGFLISVGPVR